jgi:hypothetical protein
VSCKWGTGTTCERPSNTGASKELESKLKEMMAQRTQQDVAWFAPPQEQNQTSFGRDKETKKNTNSK